MKRTFTLLEVLAAMVLAAAVLPVALRGLSLALASGGEAARMIEAAALAENKIAEIVLAADERLHAETTGEFDEPWSAYQWRSTIVAWPDGEVRELTVVVSWRRGASRRELAMATLLP